MNEIASSAQPLVTNAEAGTVPPLSSTAPVAAISRTRYSVLGAVSFVHVLNDMMQSVILAIYPLLKGEFELSFFQIGAITLTFQMTASLLQPVVGIVTDKHPLPYSLPIGMCFTLAGLLLLSVAPSYPILLLSVGLIGCGSSVFHPESSRVARMASGGRYGMAQSVFQIGGNVGQALGPLLAAGVVLTLGRSHVGWFGLAALLGIVVLLQVSRWYSHHIKERVRKRLPSDQPMFSAAVVRRTISVLMVLMFSKFFYLASISSYYEFYLIHHFGLSMTAATHLLAVFLMAVAAGTLIGGPIGDRIGRKQVIWFSILGIAPFTLLLPHVGLAWTVGLSIVIGVVLASAFPAIIVYAQDMMPYRVGMISGMFYGLSFGLGGLGAAVLGVVADHFGIVFVYQICAFLPLLGLLAVFLPDVRPPGHESIPAARTG
ncbi:MAG: MFS transporter [Rhodanobacter sp.]|nr:MAG: MFS transporter [Rhodanobacter sp.]TAL99585.1 MAG: MFS transporter [Rhodanobacter sp.]TAM41798.1 MAG: MFS transporter [Rhodanobacter sp.]TAN23248.1 MAG: MFS transporter [Rhodanobacter sp.]